MIVKMEKLLVAVRASRKDDLLASLRRQGVVHLTPVDEEKALPDERTASTVQRLSRAEQVLSNTEPQGTAPAIEPLAAAERALTLFGRSGDLRSKLASLHREAEQIGPWGDARLATFAALREAGLTVRVFAAPPEAVGVIPGDCVERVGSIGQKELVVVAQRGGVEADLPESIEELELPPRDRPTILAEANDLDGQLRAEAEELTRLANCREAIADELSRWESAARYAVADRGGFGDESLYAVQGWAPAGEAEKIAAGMQSEGIDGAVEAVAPDADEEPPTLVRYPKWARPMLGLFNILGTVPGYREFDVSGAFMIALPIFAAMLIADGGYGLLFLIPTLLLYRKMCGVAGKPLTHLILVIGGVSLVWGLLTCTFFGVGGFELQKAGGVWGSLYAVLRPLQVIGMPKATAAETLTDVRLAVTRIAFIMGVIHMSFAQLWRAFGFWPDLKALCNVGWAIFLWGMLLIVNFLVLGDSLHPAAPYLLVVGGLLAILFAAPSRNPVKMVGVGLANFPLAALGTLSDTISYIRLMAVGLASGILASTFNTLGAMLAENATWFAGGAVILLGHALNVGLAVIALFAHGVRLNMLEFSNNLGMAWNGYSYRPFSEKKVQES